MNEARELSPNSILDLFGVRAAEDKDFLDARADESFKGPVKQGYIT